MVDRSVLYTIELFTLGVKALIHTRVVLMLEITDYWTNEQKTGQ
jgi:hypothetical protein